MNMGDVSLTTHVLDRYHLFYPTANANDVRQAMSEGFEIDPRSAWAITGRSANGMPLNKGTMYIMHRERTGMFAIRKEGRVAVTFLRFEEYQRERVLKLWPIQEEPPAVPENIIIPDYMTELDTNPFQHTATFDEGPEPVRKVVQPPTPENDMQVDLRSPLPYIGVRTVDVRVSKKLLDGCTDPKPLKAIRTALWLNRRTINRVDHHHLTVTVGDQDLVLFRRPEYEKENDPEWWLCSEVPEEIDDVESKMAAMLRRRGWTLFPPSPEV